MSKAVCAVEGCCGAVLSRGWCTKHYNRWLRNGNTLLAKKRPTRVCAVAGCGKRHLGRGYCSAHYTRWRRYGDPLGGGTAWGDAVRFLEQSLGEQHGDQCLIWPYTRSATGYGYVWVDGKYHLVSRLVCEHRHGPPPSGEHHAAHSCGKGHEGCFNQNHLYWATPTRNQADRVLHGTSGRGEQSPMAKLTRDHVLEIRSLRGTDTRELAEAYGVSRQNISSIQCRRTWAWLNDDGSESLPEILNTQPNPASSSKSSLAGLAD